MPASQQGHLHAHQNMSEADDSSKEESLNLDELSPEQQQELLQSLNNGPDLFSTRRPQNFVSGVASGLKSIGKGVGAGVGCLFALPIAGAVSDGPVGFAKGLAAGSLAAVALPVASTCVAGYQIVRGACNTPGAIVSKAKGRSWDPYERKWVEYRPDQAIVLESEFNAGRQGVYERLMRLNKEDVNESDPTGDQEETGDNFYTVVGVAKDATPDDIRRSYFKRARELHPDRNPDDPQAAERFQDLGHAYQVLSDPTLRKQYDTHGEQGIEQSQLIDPGLFFSMLFGSTKFEPYIGQLALATVTSLGEDATELAMERAKLMRLVTVSKLLAQRLDEYATLGEEAFKAKYHAEALQLLAASFGDRLVPAIATAYRSGGYIAQGGVRGFGSRLRQGTRSFGFQLKALSAAAGAAFAQYSVERDVQQTVATRREKVVADREAKTRAHYDETLVTRDASDDEDAVLVDFVVPVKVRRQQEESSAVVDGASSGDVNADARASSSAAQEADATGTESADNDVTTQDSSGGEESEDDGLTAEEQAEMERLMSERTMPKALEAMWAANLVDIDRTLKLVCRAVVRGDCYGLDAITSEIRKKRGQALLLLADVFASAATTTVPSEEAPAAQRFARAAQATAMASHFGDDVDVDEVHATMAANLRQEQEAEDSTI
eukprot:m.50536 g.50536  ORF g.50536 m.50536 type:complete len:664 (+) comp13430_c0_seq1:1-1992(+)